MVQCERRDDTSLHRRGMLGPSADSDYLRTELRTPPMKTPPPLLFTMDPGAVKLGLACFTSGTLTSASTLSAPEDELPYVSVAWIQQTAAGRGFDFVTERMHKRPAQSLFDEDLDRVESCRLAIPRILGRQGFSRTYQPMMWKGNANKEMHQKRTATVLSEDEKRIWDTLGHDAKDAVAIGLFHLGRIERGGLPPSEKRTRLMPSLPPPPPLVRK